MLAAQPGQHNSDLLLRLTLLAGRTTNVAHVLFGRLGRLSFLRHFRSSFGATMNQNSSVNNSRHFAYRMLTAETSPHSRT